LHGRKLRVKWRLNRSRPVEAGKRWGHNLTSMSFGEQIKIQALGDDPASLTGLEGRLNHEGFEASTAPDKGELLRVAASSQKPDVILLYFRLDALRGSEACEHLRLANPDSAIIMLSDRNSEEDEVRGLDAGADDYIVKPFSPEVLVARIRANVRGRREAAGKRRIVEAGDLRLDVRNYLVRVKDKWIPLRPQEFKIFTILAQSLGEPLSSEELIRQTPGQWRGNPRHTVKIHISRIRSAIETPSDYTYIHTVKNVGYRFQPISKRPSSSDEHSPNEKKKRPNKVASQA
jgi:DNA-binding response OmpR family regulator